MCGICGVWYFDRSRSVSPRILSNMTDVIIHRGPDEDGFYIKDNVGLGFRRLSIIDVAGSHQPMSNEDQKIQLVFNGEIYNYQDLQKNLRDQHQFVTQGDTETIVHAYEEYGVECFKQLRGMFGLALWDDHQQRLVASVDRFGKKPFYYWHDDEKIIFASELKSILQHPDLHKEIDPEALDDYLAYGFVSAPRSIFKNISKIPAGHFMVVNAEGNIMVEPYWQPTFCLPHEYDTRPLPELAEELRHLLMEAVKIRMISDVPLGAFLSGGVDSSTIVAMMSLQSDKPVKTFSIGFTEDGFDESDYAQQIADRYQTDHTRHVVTSDIDEILPKIVKQFDEPFADYSSIPTTYVSQIARQHVTVALGGDGGDEVFGGYHRYRYGYRHQLLRSMIPEFARPLASSVGANLPSSLKIGRYLQGLDRDFLHWIVAATVSNTNERRDLYAQKSTALTAEQTQIAMLAPTENHDWLSRFQYQDMNFYLPYDILVKVDRASMLNSLEVRAPLLDYIVFEFMAKVPPKYKMSNSGSKILLKEAVKDLVPDSILYRTKQGFNSPLGQWLRDPLAELMQNALLDKTARERGIFDTSTVSKLVKNHIDGAFDYKWHLWALLSFELWARTYLDN